MPNPLNKSFARALLRMSREEILRSSDISDKTTLQKFVADGIVKKVPAGRRRYTYMVPDNQALMDYLELHYQIHSLETYLQHFEQETVSGEEALQAGYSTKTQRSSLMQGFLVNASQNMELHYNGEPLHLPVPSGSGVFLFHPGKLTLPEETTIVGVENPEVFAKIHRLAEFFSNREPCLFALRYMSKGLPGWLERIPNPYLHFGDFDLSGLAIYLREYRRRLAPKRCSFFVPPDIEQRIAQKGNRQLYEVQEQATANERFEAYPEIAQLAQIIKKHRKGLEQEALLV